MIIKKFNAPTEKQAILMARDELGPEAIVMNVKTIKPKGIFALFRKSKVEITAAIDDNISEKTQTSSQEKKTDRGISDKNYKFGSVFIGDDSENKDAQSAIEEKINNIAMLLEQQMTMKKQIEATEMMKDMEEKESPVKDFVEDKKPESKLVTLIKSQLRDSEVDDKHIDSIINEFNTESTKQTLDNLLASVYQKIVLKLGQIEPIKPATEKPKIIFFVGNTGVGKTTTMAKLASKCKLDDKCKIALLSVDTYRIAAIEQTKTYANILSAPMEVVYTPEEMQKYVEKYKDCDYIFVDTAGRSHKNEDQRADLKAITDSVKDYEKEVYLVLSAGVKYNDLMSIARAYGELFDYKVIFTKTDETSALGNILNFKLDTGKALSYITWGQNVPDDIGVLDPQIMAKKLLGGGE